MKNGASLLAPTMPTRTVSARDPVARMHVAVSITSAASDPLTRKPIIVDLSILPLRLQAEQVLTVHAAGRIPVEADVRCGGVSVAPEALQRLVEVQAVAAGREEEGVDRLDQELHAERL